MVFRDSTPMSVTCGQPSSMAVMGLAAFPTRNT
jgi:hypothetical protein